MRGRLIWRVIYRLILRLLVVLADLAEWTIWRLHSYPFLWWSGPVRVYSVALVGASRGRCVACTLLVLKALTGFVWHCLERLLLWGMLKLIRTKRCICHCLLLLVLALLLLPLLNLASHVTLNLHSCDYHAVLNGRPSTNLMEYVDADWIVSQKLVEGVGARVEVQVSGQTLHLRYGFLELEASIKLRLTGDLWSGGEDFPDSHITLNLYLLETLVDVLGLVLHGWADRTTCGVSWLWLMNWTRSPLLRASKALIDERLHVDA